VRVAIGGIDLNRVLELNCCFAILAFIEIVLTALKILLLAYVGVAGAANKKNSDQSQRQN
jgi:hypothetical protein